MTEITVEATSPETKPPVILCVYDEPNILFSLQSLFRPTGFQILVAESEKEGLAVLKV